MKKQKSRWWVYVLVFLLGMFLAPSKKCDSEVLVSEVVKESCSQEETWRELKEVDDAGFALAGQGFIIVSEAFDAAAEGDVDLLTDKVSEMDSVATQIQEVLEKRGTVLAELGY